jgi:hypothetical protein
VLLLALFLLVSCNNDINPDPTTTTSTKSTQPTKKNNSSVELTRDDVKVMFENNATFDELKEKYNLEIEDESEFGELVTVCDDNPDIRFYFWREEKNSYIIAYIEAPASMLLPEYVNVNVDKIPIVLEKGGKRGEVIFMGDKDFSYSVTVPPENILLAECLVSIEKRNTAHG